MRDIKKKNKIQNNQPIGVFDSGVGGLSVLIELKKLLPNENFVFLADQFYVPYGEKTKKELVDLAYKITDYFINKHDVKAMVVACNTSTCSSIAEVRQKYPLPIVGTVPAIKPAAEKTKTRKVGIISTPSTSQSEVLRGLIDSYCQGVEVMNVGCKNLENVVEKGELGGEEVEGLLRKYLEGVKNSNADCLVLGCTHYPFLKKAIRKVVGRPIKLIDGNKAIAKQTKKLLEKFSIKNSSNVLGNSIYYSTGDSAKFSEVASKLMKEKIVAKKVTL